MFKVRPRNMVNSNDLDAEVLFVHKLKSPSSMSKSICMKSCPYDKDTTRSLP